MQFLRDFRTTSDGLKSLMAIYTLTFIVNVFCMKNLYADAVIWFEYGTGSGHFIATVITLFAVVGFIGAVGSVISVFMAAVELSKLAKETKRRKESEAS